MTQVLKNIKSIAYIEARLLSNITIVGNGVFLKYWRNWQEMPISGLAQMVVSSAVEEKSRIYTHKLTAHMPVSFDVADRHLCFLATAVDGTRYLIGRQEQPYPIVTTEDTMPSSETEKSGCTLNVSYVSSLGLVEVLD